MDVVTTITPERSNWTMLFAIIGGMLLVILLIALAAYIINGLFLSKVGKDLNRTDKWMAWVPICNILYLGKLAEKVSGKIGFYKKYMISVICYLCLAFVSGIVSGQSFSFVSSSYDTHNSAIASIFALLMAASAIVFIVFDCIAIYDVFKFYDADRATMYLILSILIPLSSLIICIILMSTRVGKGYVSYNANEDIRQD